MTSVQLRLGAPVATIGEADGAPEYLLSKVGGVQLRDGRIVVADNGSAQLRFYDGRGRFLKAIGRRGGGPGEFGWLQLVPNWSSDSLVVFDRGLNRVNIISTRGEFGRSVQLPAFGAGRTMLLAYPAFLGIDRQGRLYFESQSGATPRAPGMFRRSVTVTRIGTGANTEELGTFKGDEIIAQAANGRPTFSPLPFLQRFVRALGRDRFYYSEGPESVVYEHTAGAPTAKHSIPFEAKPLTREDFTTWFEQELKTIPAKASSQVQPTRQYYRRLYSPWTTRPVARLLVDDGDRIWIEEYSLGRGARAAVYSPRFELIGIVQLPPGFTIQHVRANLLAGLVVDEDGVERIEVRPVIGL